MKKFDLISCLLFLLLWMRLELECAASGVTTRRRRRRRSFGKVCGGFTEVDAALSNSTPSMFGNFGTFYPFHVQQRGKIVLEASVRVNAGTTTTPYVLKIEMKDEVIVGDGELTVFGVPMEDAGVDPSQRGALVEGLLPTAVYQVNFGSVKALVVGITKKGETYTTPWRSQITLYSIQEYVSGAPLSPRHKVVGFILHNGGNATWTICNDVSPPNPPKFTVNGDPVVDDVVNVDHGESLDMGCSVDGVAVSHVMIDCTGGDSTIGNGTSVTTSHVASKDIDQAQCVCSAQPRTGSYTQTTYFTIAIRHVPPPNPPIFTVNGGPIVNGVVNVDLGESLDIHCSVDGGYPDVSSVKIGCGAVRSTIGNGKSVTTNLVASEDFDQAQCVCVAQHITGLYTQTASFIIYVSGPAVIMEYSINSKTDGSQMIKLLAGDNVAFVCQAHGMPAPSVFIKQIWSDILLQGSVSISPYSYYIKIFEKTKIMACGDSGKYECVAANGIGEDKKELEVTVNCPPHLEDDNWAPLPEMQFTKLGHLQSTIIVVSNPAIKSSKLAKYQQNAQTGSPKLIKEFKQSEYSFSKTYNAVTNNIILGLLDLYPDETYFYTLTLTNGLEPDLNINFSSSFARGAGAATDGSDSQSAVSLYFASSLVGSAAVAVIVGFIVITVIIIAFLTLIQFKDQ